MWPWKTVVTVSCCCHCRLHVVLRNFCCPLHLLCPFMPHTCWHNWMDSYTISRFKLLVKIKNSIKEYRWGLFLQSSLLLPVQVFISCSQVPVHLWGHPLSWGCCRCCWCPAQCSCRSKGDCSISGPMKLHLSIMGEFFFEEYLLWEFRHLRSSWVVQASYIGLSVFGNSWVKPKGNAQLPKQEARWKNVFMSFV